MSLPIKETTREKISIAQVSVREIAPQERLEILDREIKNIRGWIKVYLKAGQTQEAATHQATLKRFEIDRERLLVEMKINPQAHERLLKIRAYLFERETRKMRDALPELTETHDDLARLVKAVKK